MHDPAVGRGRLAVDRIVVAHCLALLDKVDADERVRDDLQPDFGAVGGEAASCAGRCRATTSLAVRADAGKRAQRDRVGDAHRREQAEAGLAHVLDFPGAARRGELREPAARELEAAIRSRCARVRTPRAPSCRRSSSPMLEVRASAPLLLAQIARDLARSPTMASTLPAAELRSPRRANGLNSGSTCEASLVSRAELLAAPRGASDSGWPLIFCSSIDDVLHQERMQRRACRGRARGLRAARAGGGAGPSRLPRST